MTLSLNQIEFERNNEYLFHSVSFTQKAGEMLQINGANGCGKSTLLRIIAGYLEPQQGDVVWEGKSIFRQLDDYQQQIHYVGHQNGLKLQLTVIENLKLISALHIKKPVMSQLTDILEQLGLTHLIDTQALYLSAGQKRRLALARLLLTPRKLWILDEPTTALDSLGQLLLTELLAKHLSEKGIAIIATHHELGMREQIKKITLEKYRENQHV
jgi:heme exporter protein A